MFEDWPEKVVCSECNEESLSKDWEETYVGCEDCGEHPALTCPQCGLTYDEIYLTIVGGMVE